jgi:sec-independent protein translocase protein TatB
VFDVGWTELVVIACVAILVVGPKDLPRMLRTFGRTMSTVRKMAGDFRRQFDDAIRETELDDIRKSVTQGPAFNPLEDARKTMLEAQKSLKEAVQPAVREIEAAANAAHSDLATPPVVAPAPDLEGAAKPAAETVAADPAAKP